MAYHSRGGIHDCGCPPIAWTSPLRVPPNSSRHLALRTKASGMARPAKETAQGSQQGDTRLPARDDAWRVSPGTRPRWTFLTNHSHVLILLHANPDIVLREVALAVGVTERAVQRIIQELESDGFIERERIGRRNRYRVLTDQRLRHPIERHRSIGDLLRLVGSAPVDAGDAE
jgi:DNA-binding transcriptional ArsR family regulator